MSESTDVNETLQDYLDNFGGELDGLALLQDLYKRDDVSISWPSYILPQTKGEVAGKTVVDTFREYRAEMSDEQLAKLQSLVEDEQVERGDSHD